MSDVLQAIAFVVLAIVVVLGIATVIGIFIGPQSIDVQPSPEDPLERLFKNRRERWRQKRLDEARQQSELEDRLGVTKTISTAFIEEI